MQVTGKFSNVVEKVKVSGVPALYHGSLAAGKCNVFPNSKKWLMNICSNIAL